MKRKRTLITMSGLFAALVGVACVVLLTVRNSEQIARRRHDSAAIDGFSTVYGRVQNKNGRAVRFGGDIQLCGEACFSAQVTLGGNFVFNGIPPGQYRLFAVHNACYSEEQLVNIGYQAVFSSLSEPLITSRC